MLTIKKSAIEKLILPFSKPFAQVNPNLITILGSIPPLVFFVLVLTHHFIFALLVLTGTAIDMLDGLVARRYKKVTKFGEFLDASVDRLSDAFIITAFGFAHVIRWEFVILLLVTSYLVSYISARGGEAGRGTVKISGGIMERTERTIGIAILLLIYLLWSKIHIGFLTITEAFSLLLIILSVITVGQRIFLAYRRLIAF